MCWGGGGGSYDVSPLFMKSGGPTKRGGGGGETPGHPGSTSGVAMNIACTCILVELLGN